MLMYWLSKRNYEPALVDYVGIDIVSYDKFKDERIGISVKSRTRKEGTETENISMKANQIPKIRKACDYFDCKPYFGCVIDKNAPQNISIFLLPLEDVLAINHFKDGNTRLYIRFTEEYIKEYRQLPESFIIEMDYKETRKNM